MSDEQVRAMVQTGPRTFEMWDMPRPRVGDCDALIRLEACGICGSDIEMYRAEPHPGFQHEFPVIRGHEPVGTIEEIGPVMSARLGLKPGHRVAVDPFIRCGSCRYCLDGRGELCNGGARPHNTYAMIPTTESPGLWGGFATHLFATSGTVLYRIPEHVPPTLAALFNVLGAGVKWGVDVAGTKLGSKVVVLGCGQRGLACAVSALEAGAEFVAVTGLTKDHYKLELAEELGIHLALDIEKADLTSAVWDATGVGADIVIDTTPFAADAVADAIEITRAGGTIVVAGIKGRPADGFPIDDVTKKEITIRGVLGTGSDHYRRAISMIAGGKIPWQRLQTHVVPLERLEWGIQVLAGEIDDEQPLNIVIDTA